MYIQNDAYKNYSKIFKVYINIYLYLLIKLKHYMIFFCEFDETSFAATFGLMDISEYYASPMYPVYVP